MTLVTAIISVCLVAAPSQCEQHTLRVEPRACHIAPIRAEAPVAGQWLPAEAKITCQPIR